MRNIAQVQEWAATHPQREGGSWLGFSGSLIHRALELKKAYVSVNHARLDSTIVSRDASEAPVGAIHWWQSQYGQAGIDIDGGGKRVLISSVVGRWIGDGIGYASVEEQSLHLHYFGWSLSYGEQS